MKCITGIAILVSLLSCRHQPNDRKDIFKLVNDQNDGWNAFSITLRNDNTYKREDFGSNETGKYSVSDTIILLNGNNQSGGKIIFDTTRFGCPYNIKYFQTDNPTSMRVVFDSMFCGHILKNLLGSRVYLNRLSEFDTLQLNDDKTARFIGSAYSKWDFEGPEIWLYLNNTSEYLLVLNLNQDSIWFHPKSSIDENYSIKAIRLK
jgi:hypothetical protein